MGGAVLLGALFLYLVTLDNGLTPGELQGGDLITHHHAQAELRLANAPGYPLYTLLGWAWFQAGRFIFSSLLTPIEILSLFHHLGSGGPSRILSSPLGGNRRKLDHLRLLHPPLDPFGLPLGEEWRR